MTEQPGDPLAVGLYEELITSRVEQRLQALLTPALTEDLHADEAADRLTLHLARLVERSLIALPRDQRAERGAALLRDVGRQLQALAPRLEVLADLPDAAPQVLRAVRSVAPDGSPASMTQPLIPLLDTTLLTNAPGEPSLSRALVTEIDSADRIDAIIAFIRVTGIGPLRDSLRRHVERGRPLRVLTTTYTNSTQQRALDLLAELGAEIRVSYDTTQTRLHAKSWLFTRASGASTAYVGSSNLTHSAQVLGQEWNVRISGRRNPALLAKMDAAFEGAWENGDFLAYDPVQFAAETRQAGAGPALLLSPVELRLEPFQDRMLELVEAARLRGHHRNLLVSATGTGKTVMAAVDYARLTHRLPRARLLFVAHRRELLEQAQGTFRQALRDAAFGELWVAGQRPERFEHVFASIQSLREVHQHLDPEHFDVIVVDEFHHAAAPTYDRLLRHVRPRELLGLTATPERDDGQSVLGWFDNRVAAELRLWDAIEQQRLVPFQYFGIHDGADLTGIPWQRGRGYDTEALTNLYTADDVWADRVIRQTLRRVPDVAGMRALGFCVSVGHAQFMASRFRAAGIAAVAVTGDTPRAERSDALQRLHDGRLSAVFSVDVFNEGVDVPAVDTLLLLRPTDSATVFQQQLGRGLRRSPTTSKTVCTVLDFVSQHRREYRLDRRFRALLGGSRAELERHVRDGFPFLPTGCHLELDPVATQLVLRSLKDAVPLRWQQRVGELRALLAERPQASLADYLAATGLELEDLYGGSQVRGWSDLRQAAGAPVLPAGPHEPQLRRAVARATHVDDSERTEAFLEFAGRDRPPAPGSRREQALLRMFVVTLAGQVLGGQDLMAAARLLWRHPQVLAEVGEVLRVLRQRIDHVQSPLPRRPDVPLQVHARYTREEILAAFHEGDRARTPPWREGVRFCRQQQADLLLVTLNKTPQRFSPTTRYRDHAISRTLFHWESQSTTSATSPTGQRYQHHEAQGSQVLLFVRQDSDERAFWCCGPVTYVRHEGERPMAITWRLTQALPADLYADFAATAVG